MAENTDTEQKLVDTAKDWYQAAVDFEGARKWRKNAAKARKFYDGTGQWTESVKRLLESQGKPALTINRILPVINVIWGQQVENRRELRLYARRRGTKAIADLGSALIKHAMETCNGYEAMSDCYRDGLITGKGWATIDRVFNKDPISGEIDVTAPDPLHLFEDPRNTDYDVNEGEYLFRERFITKAKLKAYYPKKYKDAVDASNNDWSDDWDAEVASDDDSQTIRDFTRVLNDYAGGGVAAGEGTLEGFVLRECWYRKYERITVAMAMQGDRMLTARARTREDKDKLKQLQARYRGQIEVRETVIPVLHLQVMIGDLLLKHEEDPLNGMNIFPYTRYAPYWMHGKAFGVVDNLIGPQEEHNKARSQALNLLNQTGNNIWKGGTASPEARRAIQEYGSTPGAYFDVNDYGGDLKREDPHPISQGHMVFAEQSSTDIREISGANPDVTGTNPNQSESGRARLVRIKAGMTTLAPLLSNLQRSQGLFGNAMWEYLRNNDVYTPEEIGAVVDEDVISEIGGLRGAVEAMNRWDVGSYGVKTEMSATNRTFRDAQLEDVREISGFLREVGLQVTPEVANELLQNVVRLSDFPGRDKVVNMLKQAPVALVPPEGAAPKRPAVEAAGGVG